MRVLVQTRPDEYKVLEISSISYNDEFYVVSSYEDANDYQGDTSGLTFFDTNGTLFAIPGVTLNDANAICKQICITGYADLSEYEVCIDVTHLP